MELRLDGRRAQGTGTRSGVGLAARARDGAAVAPFDVLFSNAGIDRLQPFPDIDLETFDVPYALNVRAAFVVALAAR